MDMGSISAAVGGLKATGDIFKALLGMKINSEAMSQIIDLQRVVLEAQGNVLSGQSDYMSLVQSKTDLEQEIVRLKDWGAERENYKLTDLGRGSTAYALKPSVSPKQEPHWLCTNCYHDHKKSILQPQGNIEGETVWACAACKSAQRVFDTASPRSIFDGERSAHLGKGDQCPKCRQYEMRTESISEIGGAFAALGLKNHNLKCANCEFEMQKEVEH